MNNHKPCDYDVESAIRSVLAAPNSNASRGLAHQIREAMKAAGIEFLMKRPEPNYHPPQLLRQILDDANVARRREDTGYWRLEVIKALYELAHRVEALEK